ncbi:MAG TPA: hypothetical protein VHZ03_09045 [Trebonia sp.]|nr:hypothetical protein [Trebonia sp.]
MLTGAYQVFFTAIAGAAAALTGLLFVALSVTSRSRFAGYPAVIRDVRAAAALLAFSDALTVSLFSLVPETNTGYPALVTGVFGLMFTAAGVRSIITSPETTAAQVRRQAGLVVALLVAFGFEIYGGIQLMANPASPGGAQTVSYVLAGLVLAGIARAWELVSDRDTGLLSSIAVLAGRDIAGGDGTAGRGAPLGLAASDNSNAAPVPPGAADSGAADPPQES